MQTSDLLTVLPPEPKRPVLKLPDAGRAGGTLVLGSRGSGKSRLVGRSVVFQDFLRGIPTIIFDPIGGTIANALDKVLRLDATTQQHAWQRIRYIDMAGTKTHVVPFPLLYPATSPYYAAQRPVELFRRIDPALASASVLGFNALKKIATDVGMLLFALGWQFSEAEALLQNPRRFECQIREAVARYPDIAEAAAFFLSDEYQKTNARERDMQQSAFLRKLSGINRESSLRAVFAADTPVIDWQEVVDKRLLVLLDFSRVPDAEKQFCLLWVFSSLVEWIKLKRGIGRHIPLSLVIDELTFLVGNREQKNDVLAQDLNQLVSVISRNAQIWLTLMSQELNQFSYEMQDVLLTLANQFFGVTSDPKAAAKIAKRYYGYNPGWIKRTERVWGSSPYKGDYVRDLRFIEYSVQEQEELNTRRFLVLPRLTFLAGISLNEGQLPTDLQHLSIEQLDTGQYPNMALIRNVQAHLMRRDGLGIETISQQIQRRLGAVPEPIAQPTFTPRGRR